MTAGNIRKAQAGRRFSAEFTGEKDTAVLSGTGSKEHGALGNLRF